MTINDIPIDFDPRWLAVLEKVKHRFGKKPDIEALLFLIGIQELALPITKFTKEQKQDLMHLATCKLLSYSGYYHYIGKDGDGWPHWKPANNLPVMTLMEQELLLKKNIIRYFEEMDSENN